MMKIDTSEYRVQPGETVDLTQRATKIEPVYDAKKKYKKILEDQVEQLSDLQRLHYASNQHSLLLIFQGMDTAGKDGVIRHVMSGVDPQGCQVFSFKQPSTEELEHDFLWRTTKRLPERGRIGIFNRSYYEDVLIARVHPELLTAQGFSDDAVAGNAIWNERFKSITDLEAHLHSNGTKVIKFFLHLSKDEQRDRFLARIDEPEKNWKFSLADIKEREHWDDYMRAYELCLSATSSKESPWFVIPADDKKNARLIISQIVVDTLQDFSMSYPKVSAARRRELLKLRKQLEGSK
jgi:PPK2 family polyphosphate:nucleotide phosphotransferase